MARPNRPVHGSRGYSPRKRAESQVCRIKAWPEIEGKPKIQGFAGYKVGMTHAHVLDYRPHSTTSGQEVQMPVTIVEVPPMKVAAVRTYKETPYGLQTITEVWASGVDSDLISLPENYKPDFSEMDKFNGETADVRVLAYTTPELITGVPKKNPELMEVRIGGGNVQERLEYAKSVLGKDVDVSETIREGDMLDAIAVTKGFGFQGHVKRYGVKLLSHKNSKHRRMIGTSGSFTPHYIKPGTPQAGQDGYQQRTQYNMRVLKIGEKGEEINPQGGFLHYGLVRNKYVMFHGSLPGPTKRLIRFRDAIRYQRGIKVEKAQINFVSTESKQGA
ncbi:MAG: 50S ribosomal protein L3 [Candidatus Thermoplasmatota archaeon]|nr:50S ribosomal protein L3 [Candidatus Thermoplasmatota archaeon]